MISGSVSVLRGPIIPVVICDSDGSEHTLSAIVDTGVTGWLTLPADVISALRLLCRAQRAGVLADGKEIVYKSYEAQVIWDGRSVTVRVSELGSEPLIGMRLMLGCRILIDDVDGGAVRIERL